MVTSSVAPDDPAAHRGISRRTQSDIYRAGISGTRPAVPIDAAGLETAARKALSAEAFAYIAGGAGAERTVAANRAAFDRWQVWPRPCATSRRATSAWSSSAGRVRPRCCSRRWG
ncbi:alpha-hydroxy-acid oxidizing protein [Microbacterium sp. Se5.02b]|uniref:alpha-hydroxy-acid oxidizing protein n=1 Tax=Microbacterium sp. Se63.02b TaxID=2709304 RepID=UPI002867C9E8|nr:alpha-hydroxy-acid oxidizing protein [Microbacterium sp. Se5.02b]